MPIPQQFPSIQTGPLPPRQLQAVLGQVAQHFLRAQQLVELAEDLADACLHAGVGINPDLASAITDQSRRQMMDQVTAPGLGKSAGVQAQPQIVQLGFAYLNLYS